MYAAIQHFGGENIRCFPAHSNRPNANLIELADGSIDVYRLGEDRHDVTIEVTAADDETMQVIEEIIRRGIPCCIYPRMEGSVQMSLPLIRGLGVDGENMTVTHTLTLAEDTILYMPHADSGRMLYMDRIAVAGLPIMDGVQTRAVLTSSQNPLGRGMYVPALGKNLLKAPNLNAVNYTAPLPADGWRWAAGGDTWNTHAGMKASPWHDGYSYWTRSTNNYLYSNKFDLTTTTNKAFLVSFCYRVSGTLVAQVYSSAGAALHSAITITSGTGRVQWPVPVITGAADTDCTLRFTLTAGEYAEIACPQIMTASPDAIGDYLPYLGGDETDVQPEITASQLKVEGDFGMDTAAYSGDGSTWDGYMCVSGYIQPGYDVAYRANKTIAFLERYLGATNGDIELRFQPGGSFYQVALYSGGTLRDSETITTPTRGEAFAWTLYSGRTDGALVSGAYLISLLTGTEYNLTWAGGIGFANRLFIGCRSTAGYGADALLSGVTVSSANTVTAVRDLARRLGDPEVADLFRRTAGRWYRLVPAVSPRRHDRRMWEGTFNCTEVKAL
jgi:hypothetical protein